jgi:hypothetical protein
MTDYKEDSFIITYSNHLEFNGVLLAFRKKELFNISNIPQHIKQVNINGSYGWWINRKFLTVTKAKELIKQEPKQVDVTNLQWYLQIELNECFNLWKK